MNSRLKASLLWGAVGTLSFLVLVQGYELASDVRVPVSLKFVAGGIVAVAATGSTYLAEPLLFGENGSV